MMKHLKLFEELKPLLNGITFEYTESSELGQNTISQVILNGDRAIGFVRYSDVDRYTKEKYGDGIYSVSVAFINDNNFFRKGIYTNALIDFIRKYNSTLVSNSDGRNSKSEGVWVKLYNNPPKDIIVDFENDNYTLKQRPIET